MKSLEINNWLEKQVIFTGEPPYEIEIKGNRKIYLYDKLQLGNDLIADYEIIPNCLYMRVRQNCGLNGWRYITCYSKSGRLLKPMQKE